MWQSIKSSRSMKASGLHGISMSAGSVVIAT